MKTLALVLLLAGCTDREVPIGNNGPPDATSGGTDGGGDAATTIDAEVPDATPPADQRILFLVEISDAMSILDQHVSRAMSVLAVLMQHKGRQDYFDIVAFESAMIHLTPSGFTDTPDSAMITTGLTEADQMSDYEGALDFASQVLDTDAKGLTPTQRANLHYTVVLMAGSLPSPECDGDPAACGGSYCDAGNDCRLGTCIADEKVCTVDRSQWINLDPPQGAGWFPSLVQGMNYNTANRVANKVKALTALAAQDQIGRGISVDTVLVFDPDAVNNPNFASLLADRAVSQNFLQALAAAGGGNFIDLSKQPLPY